MPKNFNKRRRGKSRKVIRKSVKDETQQVKMPNNMTFRDDKDRVIEKAFLIVCEGQTEAGYFEGLCEIKGIRKNFLVRVLPEKEQGNENYKGATLKGLLYMAMKLQKMARIPFDEVWIVTDNDEGNAFKLHDASLERIKEVVTSSVYTQLKANHEKRLNVRAEELDKETGIYSRKRYFLNISDYLSFLQDFEINRTKQIEIIKKTEKREDFQKLYEGAARAFFYDKDGQFISQDNKGVEKYEKRYFDANWKNYIQIAYSCISFEYWILLHFEQSKYPFYNSRELFKYFDDNGYLTKAKTSFKKGWFLYENRTSKVVKDFFHKTEVAIHNNIILEKWSLESYPNKKLYEVNPYSDVYRLVGNLLDITVAKIGVLLNHRYFKNLVVTKNDDLIEIEFKYSKKQSELLRNIYALFSLRDKNNDILKNIDKNISNIIREGDIVTLTVEAEEDKSLAIFLCLEESLKGRMYRVVWHI